MDTVEISPSDVIDLYIYDRRSLGPGWAPSDDAYFYTGCPTSVPVAGSPIASWVDRVATAAFSTPAGRADFRLELDGLSFRGMRCVQPSRPTQYALRQLPQVTPRLPDLSTNLPLIHELLMWDKLNEGGLVVLCGLTGQGKTTLASATVRSRLERFGGRCVTVEDICEAALEGIWGKGSCRQIEVDYDTANQVTHGFAGAVRRAYRSLPATRPAMLFIGEVRDGETAAEVVKAASNGMLVVTTVHSMDPASAIMRIADLAHAEMGDSALSALGQAVRLVVHQSLDLAPSGSGWSRGTVRCNALVCDGPSHPIANMIRERDYKHAAGIQSRQSIWLRQAGSVSELLREIGSS
ncbi:ATPase, T2SS/T4P/T4SS family [Luteimonas sp. MHLX1A]|uniref:ATPase, T2SS/T4P/T4SS family n=1 Tax=Alterluteimonas muca TaxID=2878684 RepID=UPI001E3D6977|nr:ATPase, T2SS/T4P/T4SS family [Luteimonas sp. MHLX1A]MCD9046776.1 Flp pilus assembly complex ATPase component TadA [Luteimonas sp. MHLX1A]